MADCPCNSGITEVADLVAAARGALDCFRAYSEHMPAYMHGEPLKAHVKRLEKAIHHAQEAYRLRQFVSGRGQEIGVGG